MRYRKMIKTTKNDIRSNHREMLDYNNIQQEIEKFKEKSEMAGKLMDFPDQTPTTYHADCQRNRFEPKYGSEGL